MHDLPDHDLADVALPDCPPPPPPPPCETDGAVSDPAAHPGLVRDCTILLGLRDMLAGEGTLNWDPATHMLLWDGVVIHGEPRRVWALDLSWRGLSGRIPPDLAGLTELRVLWLGATG